MPWYFSHQGFHHRCFISTFWAPQLLNIKCLNTPKYIHWISCTYFKSLGCTDLLILTVNNKFNITLVLKKIIFNLPNTQAKWKEKEIFSDCWPHIWFVQSDRYSCRNYLTWLHGTCNGCALNGLLVGGPLKEELMTSLMFYVTLFCIYDII